MNSTVPSSKAWPIGFLITFFTILQGDCKTGLGFYPSPPNLNQKRTVVAFFYRYTQAVRSEVGAVMEKDRETYGCSKASTKSNEGTEL